MESDSKADKKKELLPQWKAEYRLRVLDPAMRQKLRDRKREQYWEKQGSEAPPIKKIGNGRKRTIVPDDLTDSELLFNVDTNRQLEFISS